MGKIKVKVEVKIKKNLLPGSGEGYTVLKSGYWF